MNLKRTITRAQNGTNLDWVERLRNKGIRIIFLGKGDYTDPIHQILGKLEKCTGGKTEFEWYYSGAFLYTRVLKGTGKLKRITP